MKEENKDIKSLSALLTQENKQYVIAVANALLFSQKREEAVIQSIDEKTQEEFPKRWKKGRTLEGSGT